MLTNSEIQKLIATPKEIIKKSPTNGYDKKSGSQRYCNLDLQSIEAREELFSVFIRQNSEFIENFSIGLRYRTRERGQGNITLVRYNGPHGEKSRHSDGHYNKPHIHTLTEEEMVSGSIQLEEKSRKITDKYKTFEEALLVFCKDMKIINYSQHFPGLEQRNIFE